MGVYEIIGYAGALIIGLVLGLIGGGGSILTVPIFAYLFFLNPVTATAYSLFVVGVSALVGTLRNIQKKLVDFKRAFIFATPALVTIFITRRFIIHNIPEQLFFIGEYLVTKSIAIMVFFALVMLAASITMIRNKNPEPQPGETVELNYLLVILTGIVLGFITGLVGAGGGFLIIPLLIIVAKLPMKRAVATSLLIIAVNSLIGFAGDLGPLDINWRFLLPFTAIAVIGIFAGIRLSNYIDGSKLKKAFGWFVLLMGVYIIFKESSR